MVRQLFPQKDIRIIAPYGRGYSMDLVDAAGGIRHARRMKQVHVKRSLLPDRVHSADGILVATRPVKYTPPAQRWLLLAFGLGISTAPNAFHLWVIPR